MRVCRIAGHLAHEALGLEEDGAGLVARNQLQTLLRFDDLGSMLRSLEHFRPNSWRKYPVFYIKNAAMYIFIHKSQKLIFIKVTRLVKITKKLSQHWPQEKMQKLIVESYV
jgi:hypothetical protein